MTVKYLNKLGNKKFLCLLIFAFFAGQLLSQRNTSETSIEKITLEYKSKQRKARLIKVTTEFSVPVEVFWKAEQLIENTEKVAKPMTYLNMIDAPDSPYFIQDSLYIMRPLSFGFIPVGGKHYIFIEEINHQHFYIQTREYNSIAKIWDHKLSWVQTENGNVSYTDEIELYAGAMTPFFAWYLKQFYKKRHKNWSKLLVK